MHCLQATESRPENKASTRVHKHCTLHKLKISSPVSSTGEDNESSFATVSEHVYKDLGGLVVVVV